MEKLLNYNWNVYKLFKNGKRAKAPLIQFEASEEEHKTYFKEEVLSNFNNKMRQARYELVRADLCQMRKNEQLNEEDALFEKQKRRVLAAITKNLNIEDSRRNLTTGLIFYKESNWEWQWALLEGGTSNYIAGLSPSFCNHGDAIQWIHDQISLIK